MERKNISRLSLEELSKFYPNISEGRKEMVEYVSRDFFDKYYDINGVDWKNAAKGEDIYLFEDKKVIVPFCHTSLRAVFVQPYSLIFPKKYSEFSRAHEFGHVLLNHKGGHVYTKEDEANYFSYCILGEGFNPRSIDIFTFFGALSNIFLIILTLQIILYLQIRVLERFC